MEKTAPENTAPKVNIPREQTEHPQEIKEQKLPLNKRIYEAALRAGQRLNTSTTTGESVREIGDRGTPAEGQAKKLKKAR